ncbi:MAG TPA: hypothetical protein G4O00_10555 [Thermoflexia bacterium]|nr:hypothetical protein [Thermoflexia bacterium]
MANGKRDRRGAIYLLLGLAFACLGQYYFTFRRPFYRDGIVFYGVALVMFTLLWQRVGRARRRLPRAGGWRWVRAHPRRTLALVGGAVLSLWAGWSAARRPSDAAFDDPLWLWFIGVLWFLLAFAPSLPVGWRQRFLVWLRDRRSDWVRMVALLAAALLVRAVALGEVPRNFGGDEGTQALAALKLVEPPLGNPFSTGWYSVPTMSFLAYGVAMRVFGATVAGARMLSALVGTATVLTTFLLARELGGRRVGWLAALFLAFGHYHLHFSRLASNQIGDALFASLGLWLLVRGLRSGGRGTLALSGAVMGAGWYGYFGARIVPVFAGLYLLWRVLVEPRFLRRQGRNLAAMVAAGLVVLAPLLFHYLTHPETLTARYDQVSIFASGWLAREQEITGRTALSLLLEQFWKSISAFHYTLDPTFWYHPTIPLLDFVSGVLMIIGLVWATVRWRWPANGLLLLWFWLAVVMGWTLTENPPSSMRLLVVTPAVASLVALGLDRLLRLTRSLVGGRAVVWACVGAGIVAVAVSLNLGYYFLHYAPTRVYGNPTAEVADVLCDVLERREEVPPIFFDGAPYMYWDFGAIAFRLRRLEGTDFSPEEWFWGVEPERGALFVILGEKADDLEQVRSVFPGGRLEQYYSDADGRLLFILYEVPPSSDTSLLDLWRRL